MCVAQLAKAPASSFVHAQEGFAARAMSNQYGRPVIGWADDVARLGRREVDAFFKRHYGPQSLTVTIVGDVDPAQASNRVST